MTFRERAAVLRANDLLGEARSDLVRALDGLGTMTSIAWQEMAQAKILEVSAAMDVGTFSLPHPWDLRARDDKGRVMDAAQETMRKALRVLPLDTTNRFCITAHGLSVVLQKLPPAVMHATTALELAAWLIVGADLAGHGCPMEVVQKTVEAIHAC